MLNMLISHEEHAEQHNIIMTNSFVTGCWLDVHFVASSGMSPTNLNCPCHYAGFKFLEGVTLFLCFDDCSREVATDTQARALMVSLNLLLSIRMYTD